MTARVAIAIAALTLVVCAAAPAPAQPTRDEDALAQQRRPRIVIHPRSLQPGPDARRYCRTKHTDKKRPSGQVITPLRECWWQ